MKCPCLVEQFRLLFWYMKKIIPVLLFLLFASITSQVSAARKPSPNPTPTPVAHSVCIDAGHGGTETGTVYKDPVTGEVVYKESDINLLVAEKLQAILIAEPYKRTVFMTRTRPAEGEEEPTLDNADRYTYCNSMGAAILVSIHHNGSTDPTVNYSMSLYKKDIDVPLANIVVDAVSNALGLYNRGISRFASGVLLKSNMPATISEAFFLTNENVVTMIETNKVLDTEAKALSDAIDTYFSSVQ
jgi:N-acetylmuramoyl-L-alanine amidase